ncbi:MAG: GAF domain-containing protein, partial [bacterium]
MSEKTWLKTLVSLQRALEKGNFEEFLFRVCALIESQLRLKAVAILLRGDSEWEYAISSWGNLEPRVRDFLIQKRFVQMALNSRKIISSRKTLLAPGLPPGMASAIPLEGSKSQGVLIAFYEKSLHLTAARKGKLKAFSFFLSPFLSFCQEKRRESLLALMLDLSEKATTSLSLDEALSALLEMLSCRYPQSFLSLRLLEGEMLKARWVKGPPGWSGLERDFRLGEGGAGLAALKRSPLYIPDIEEDERLNKLPGNFRALVKTYIGIPLMFQNTLRGVLELNFPQETELTRGDISFLTVASNLAALVLQAFLSREEALAKQEELRSILLGTITSLSLAVEAKDSYTGTHLKDVQEITRKIGSLMGLSPEELEDLQYAAVLHD